MPPRRFPVGHDVGRLAPMHLGESFFFDNNGAVDIDVYRKEAPLKQPAYVVPKAVGAVPGSVQVDIKADAAAGDYEYICYPVPAGIYIQANPKIIIQ